MSGQQPSAPKPSGLNRWILIAVAAVVAVLGILAIYSRESREPTNADEGLPTVRVGVLEYGTVNWELDVVKEHELNKKEGINVKVVPLASKNATAVALQGDAVDVIVTDWIWVTRQRASGLDYTFYPYSVAAGGIIVRPGAGIDSLSDLSGRKIGIAGGPVDKSWLLLQAYARKTLDVDLAKTVNPVYGAPPLLNELILKGEIDANLTFWNFEARLKANGMKQLITIPEVIHALVNEREVPVLGWVFNDAWAAKNPKLVKGLLRSVDGAKEILAESDAEWDRLRPVMGSPDDAEFKELRAAFRAGIPKATPEQNAKAAQSVFRVMADYGGEELVGKARELQPGTFYTGSLD